MKFTTQLCTLNVLFAGFAFSATVSQNNVLDDQRWFSDQTDPADAGPGPYGTLAANSSLVSSTDPHRQNFDERSLTFTDLSGATIDELFIVVDVIGTTTPVYDDGFAIDLNGDNTIDFAFTQNDAIATPGIDNFANYSPWTDASPLVLEITITPTGTTVNALWNGIAVQNLGSSPTGFNNTSAFTLQDLGFTASGGVPSDNFTTSGMRIGPINTIGGSVLASTDFNFDGIRITDDTGNVSYFDPDGDGLPTTIPEPSSCALVGLSILILLTRKKRS